MPLLRPSIGHRLAVRVDARCVGEVLGVALTKYFESRCDPDRCQKRYFSVRRIEDVSPRCFSEWGLFFCRQCLCYAAYLYHHTHGRIVKELICTSPVLSLPGEQERENTHKITQCTALLYDGQERTDRFVTLFSSPLPSWHSASNARCDSQLEKLCVKKPRGDGKKGREADSTALRCPETLHFPWKRQFSVFSLNPLSTGQSKIGRRRPISLDYHCVNISQRIFINKTSLERSFHYLNADTLIVKIGQEMTPLQPFEVAQLIDFALDRSTSVTCGRDFTHSITMVTWNV